MTPLSKLQFYRSTDRIGVGKSFLRWFGSIVSAVLLTIGYLMVAFTERKQGLHDKIAGTLVVRS